VCDMTLATNRTFLVGGEKREETCFIDVAVWGKQGEACGKFLRKGRPILIEGRLVLQQWEKDGEKRSKHIITAERVQFLGAPKGAPADVETPAAGEDEVPF